MRTMKDSGIEWIGEIPAEWICDKVCRQFALIGSGTTPKSDNDSNYIGNIHWIQSGDINGGILHNTKNKVSNEVIEKYSALKVYKAPFIVIAMYGASIGNISSSIIDGCVNQACCVLSEGHMNIKYAFYTLKSAKDYLIYNGVGGGQPNISQDIVKQLRLPVPSIREQEMIADYLDKKCAEIDAVIEKTKATIEEYKKLKQSIITEAVTKGIRGDRPMKDSGIAWVPKIAADWHISRIGLHYDVILGKMLCDRQLQDDYTLEDYFCAANVHFDGVATQGLKKMWFSPAERENYHVNIGDLLVVEGGAGAGGAAIVTELINPTYIQNSIMIVRGKHSQTNRYLRYWIECLVKKGYIDVVCNKATIPHFTKDKLATMPIPVLDETEMVEIADYLDEKCLQLDALIARKTALLEEMESYKKSVIYEYVTGKKEVECF